MVKQPSIPFSTPMLLVAVLSLVGLGLVMVASSSLAYSEAKRLPTFYFTIRQGLALGIGLVACVIATYIPLRFWQHLSILILIVSVLCLSLVLIPGISHPVNGSLRWLFMGPFSVQISEFVKIGMIIYFADFLVRRREEIQHKFVGLLRPIIILAVVSGLLLLEPDFGAAVVIVLTSLGLMFLGGMPLRYFLILGGTAICLLLGLMVAAPYRISRLTAFLNPWADQFNTGYQLTQSLIAFGRGGWWGVGLGNSIQKLLYLPEPHTDFLYAILAEELGLVGALIVLLLFIGIVSLAFRLGNRAMQAKNFFAGFVAYGIALWIAIQALINIGVNVGVLPTKGLTLPLMSYGGCSLIVGLFSIGLLFRVDFENPGPGQNLVSGHPYNR